MGNGDCPTIPTRTDCPALGCSFPRVFFELSRPTTIIVITDTVSDLGVLRSLIYPKLQHTSTRGAYSPHRCAIMEGYDSKSGVTEHYVARPAGNESDKSSGAASTHGAPEVTGINQDTATMPTVEEVQASKKGWFAYFKTRDFYIVLVLGCVHCLSLYHIAR